MGRLFLLDGTALAYRSHFALSRSGLTDTKGRPTGATYGFTTTLRRILELERPDLVAVALDARGKTFRHARYAAYKATRERAPEEMLEQLENIRRVVRAHGIPLYELPGYEADDVIATLARRGEAAGHEVFLVTGDKDLMQLCSERVRLYNVFKPGVDLVLQGPAEVRERFGTDPKGVVDVLAIMGDASDNIPGVKGIGEKGALKLIADFGSVEGLLAHLAEVPEKTRAKIEASRAELLLSRELATLDTEVPLDPPFESLGPPRPDERALIALLRELDFQSLVERVAKEAPPDLKRDYVTVRDADALVAMLAELRAARAFALDTETTSLFPLEAELVGLSFSASEGRAFYVPCNASPPLFRGGTPELCERLRPLLCDPALARSGQNTKYDWLVLARHGLRLPPPAFDTMVASFCAAGSARRHSLDSLALHYFGLKKIPTSALIGSGAKEITMAEVPLEQVAEYACEDADFTWRVQAPLARDLEAEGALKLFQELEMPLVPVLAAMEERGIRLDTELLAVLGKDLEQELARHVWEIQGLAGENLNVNSTKALGEVLFEKLRIQDQAKVKRVRRTQTGYATDAETLETQYGDVEIVRRLLQYREVAKLKSTYIDALPRYVNRATGRVHCSFSQVSAATGRLASSDPNLQNIPVRSERGRELRKAFVPRAPDGRGRWLLLSADYSQIELRVLAHLSGDENLCAAFHAGADIHAATASRIFDVMPALVTREMRNQAKVINFGLLYGMGPARVARETGLSLAEAREFIERYFGAFPKVRAWIDGVLAGARERGYVETLFGRRRRTPEILSSNSRAKSFAENAAVNTPVQGSAADIIKRAMIDLERELSGSKLGAQMLLQVHDELVLEVPEAELEETRALVKRAMEQAVKLAVPLRVDVGSGANWLEAH
jgi:DNA polymerase-1